MPSARFPRGPHARGGEERKNGAAAIGKDQLRSPVREGPTPLEARSANRVCFRREREPERHFEVSEVYRRKNAPAALATGAEAPQTLYMVAVGLEPTTSRM